MLYENQKDKEECEIITNNEFIPNNINEIFEAIFLDQKTTGFLMGYPHGLVIRQGERNHYYRGECELFPSSTSKLQRLLKNQDDFEFHRLISYMRINEFYKFICKFKHVRYWKDNLSDINNEALAQHYGITTNFLDITNDFNTALFFATCCFENGKWRPLTKKDTEENENKKYGRIFHTPSWRVMMINLIAFSEGNIGGLYPIGFQPFMRCHMQYGYAIDCKKGYCLQKDINFEKLIFRHSEKLSEEIFELMDKGRKIYPHEGLNKFEDIINTIRDTQIFSKESFKYACEKGKCSKEKIHEFEKYLKQNRYIIGDFNLDIDPTRIKILDDEYENFSIEKEYNINITFRQVIH